MTAIQIGQTLTCNDLIVCFWNECVDPAVKKDPYEVTYTIGYYEGCQEEYFVESINKTPIRSSEGCYWIPWLTSNDATLTPGKYFIRWNWRDTENGNWNSCKYEFTLYRMGYCIPHEGIASPCDCEEI